MMDKQQQIPILDEEMFADLLTGSDGLPPDEVVGAVTPWKKSNPTDSDRNGTDDYHPEFLEPELSASADRDYSVAARIPYTQP